MSLSGVTNFAPIGIEEDIFVGYVPRPCPKLPKEKPIPPENMILKDGRRIITIDINELIAPRFKLWAIRWAMRLKLFRILPVTWGRRAIELMDEWVYTDRLTHIKQKYFPRAPQGGTGEVKASEWHWGRNYSDYTNSRGSG